ncbi:MAG: hypothetical protein IJI74_01995 [Firmicutes bacterium]|nr:hypothetical protein [Bacillota bacterium]
MEEYVSYGIVSVLPVITILVIAVATRRTLFAMCCGLTVAVIILTEKAIDTPSLWFDYCCRSMANETAQWLILIIAMFGVLIKLFEKSNAVIDFGNWVTKYIKTKKQALICTALMGIIIFLEDYLNNLTVGTTMKSVTDRLAIPRTQLALIVNGMAAPVCLLIPMSSWAVFYGALLEDQGVLVNGTGMGAYIAGIPYAFYAWIIVIIVILQLLGVFPKIGRVKRDTIRAEETGNVMPEDMEPLFAHESVDEVEEGYNPKPWNFLIPLAVMVAVTIVMDINVLLGSAAGALVAIILYLAERKFTFKEMCQYSFEGLLDMGFVFALTVLAFAVVTANEDLGLANFIISITLPIMKGSFLPAVVFLVCGVYAYATGCFWDLAAIITPIVIPLAIAMDVDPIIAAAAIFSGTAFGSNTCLYGDGVILCSQGCGIQPYHLMTTTLPYAITAGVITEILYLIVGFVFM